MSKKQRMIIAAVASVAVLLAVAIPVLAYYFSEANSHTITFEPGVVNCRVIESFDPATGIKSSIAVQNTGNIDVRVRVKLVSYWVDADGNVIGKPSSMPAFTLADGWTDSGNGIYTYDIPLAPNGTSSDLLASPITLATDSDGSRQVVEVFAEAIQSAGEAAQDAWE